MDISTSSRAGREYQTDRDEKRRPHLLLFRVIVVAADLLITSHLLWYRRTDVEAMPYHPSSCRRRWNSPIKKATAIAISKAMYLAFINNSRKDARLRLAVRNNTGPTAAFRGVFIDTFFKKLDLYNEEGTDRKEMLTVGLRSCGFAVATKLYCVLR